ncbi:MAG: AraC family transcriptional regulator [Rubrivivax sp.]|jgi:AraC-like DNA-binding protein
MTAATRPTTPGALRRRAPRGAPGVQQVLPADPLRYAPDAQRPVRVKARRLSAASRIVPHRHDWAQVAYSNAGVLRVTADRHTYIVPPSRAVWIPPGVEHVVTVVEDAELRTLYVHQPQGHVGPLSQDSTDPGDGPADWRRCRVLEVTPLMRELVSQLDGSPAPGPARERLLATLVLDELHRARVVPLGVGLPEDKRLRSLCEAVLDNPARHATLDGWAAEAGASARTVARLFRQELGTTFAEWRQQVLLAKALSMAASKRPMSHIAAELGYASASAFTAMVRRSVGEPPSRFFAAAQ